MKRRATTCIKDNYCDDWKSTEVVMVENTIDPLGVKLLNPYAVNKHSSGDLVELARQIEIADSFVKTTTCAKLRVIADQIRYLKEQATSLLLEAKRTLDLNHVACNFRKVPGNTYHLYRKPSGQQYFSIVSPQEWGSSLPHEFIGSYRLLNDMMWTPSETDNSTENSNLLLLKHVLESGQDTNDTTMDVVIDV